MPQTTAPAAAGKQAGEAAIEIRDKKVSQPRIDLLHPAVRGEVTETIIEIEKGLPDNIAVRVVQGLRTIEAQDAIYAQGRTKPGKIVSNAKGGTSLHNFALAIDVALVVNGKELVWVELKTDLDKDKVPDIQEIVKPFEAKGWFWGGNFSIIKDYPHLEKKFGHPNYHWFLDQYNAGKFIPGTKYIQL